MYIESDVDNLFAKLPTRQNHYQEISHSHRLIQIAQRWPLLQEIQHASHSVIGRIEHTSTEQSLK